MHYLPDKLKGNLHSDTESAVIFLWNTFSSIMVHLETNTRGESIQENAHAFLETFISLGSSARKGYGKDRVTPYIHILARHASKKHESVGCLGWYSSQGIEKKNDILKNFHHKKSNNWNAVADALKLSKRSERLKKANSARPYCKRDLEYWKGEIRESRKKRQRAAEEPSSVPLEKDTSDMTAGELRTELRAIGIATTIKCRKKLCVMLVNARNNLRS